MTVPYTKPPISVSQQLSHLESRGLVIHDSAAALERLSRIGYYRLKAYVHPFRVAHGHGALRKGTTIEDVIACYEFDHDLRAMIFRGLEHIEIGVRALLVEHLVARFGAFAHLDSAAFPPRTKRRKNKHQKPKKELVFNYSDWLLKIRADAEGSSENFVEHFRKTYDGFPDIPCWMAMQLTSFGALAKIFYGCHPGIRKAVSNKLGINEQVLASWLHTLSYVRNTCAHHHRLWNRELAVKPELPDSKHEPLWSSSPLEHRIFLILLMMRRILRGLKDETWAQSLETGFNEAFTNSWMALRMGFPYSLDANNHVVLQDWKSHPLWA